MKLEWIKTTLPTSYGRFECYVFKNNSRDEYFVLTTPIVPDYPLVRIHSQCLTGDVFGSQRCDCGVQLQEALKQIAREGGLLLYLPQEGRGIGLFNKIKAYALQDQGLDTVEANTRLGLLEDARTYESAVAILQHFKLHQLRLMTNNPRKLKALQESGLMVERVPLYATSNPHNVDYLKTKKSKLGHL